MTDKHTSHPAKAPTSAKDISVNEIFYSLQGEGYNTGMPAVFVRFSGCNLHCPFCDTDFSSGTPVSEEDIKKEVAKYRAPLVVITGGEPALQLTESLVNLLHSIGKTVAVETNGTLALPKNADWVTLSPKDMYLGKKACPVLKEADEIKIVFDGTTGPIIQNYISKYQNILVKHRFIQPCDTGNAAKNAEIIKKTIEFCKANPEWRLSLQTHKILNIK
ncbi:MAG: radical SAM protein [Bacteroidales bacterium]|nr:radical SAM protein [Bacteroidales bacterium]